MILLLPAGVRAQSGVPDGVRSGADPAPTAVPHPLGRAASAEPELALTFEAGEVVATGLTGSGDAVVFGLAREPQGYYTRVVRRQGVEVVDPFGEARFRPESREGEAPEEVPLKSVWAVVDLETGTFGLGAPPGFRLRRIGFPGRAFEVGAPGLPGPVTRLRHRFSFVDLLVVRPGVGAWSLRAHDTGPGDHDGQDDDRATTRLEDLEPLGASGPPPDRFEAGDVLVVIHPRDLALYATRLLEPPSGRAGS